jgi:hypothetical protein
MTIDEFKAVVAISRQQVVVWRYSSVDGHPTNKHTAALIQEHEEDLFDPICDIKAEFVGHTKKAALKKLKDWYMYEGRKNANNR